MEELLTRDEAFAANLKRCHECLVEAKNCLYVAAHQTDNRARTEVYEGWTAELQDWVGNLAIVRHELGLL